MRIFSERLHTRGRFYHALATAIDAGLPVDQALTTLAGSGDRLSAAVGQVVAGGQSLSHGLAVQGVHFSRLEILAVEAGERAGRLPDVLRRLGRAFEIRAQVRDRMSYGLFYPVFLLHGAVILPPLYLLFRDGLAAYLSAILPVFAGLYGGLVVAAWLFRGLTASEAGKRRRDTLLLSLPMVSTAVRAIALADYAHALVILYSAGVPIPETLDKAAYATRNRVFRAAGLRVCEVVRAGGTLHDGLAPESNVFPQPFIQAVAVGEAAGKLEETLEKAEESARSAAERSMIMLAVGLGVAAYAIAAILVAWVAVSFWLGTTKLPEGV